VTRAPLSCDPTYAGMRARETKSRTARDRCACHCVSKTATNTRPASDLIPVKRKPMTFGSRNRRSCAATNVCRGANDAI
jgi:hypothetical protein